MTQSEKDNILHDIVKIINAYEEKNSLLSCQGQGMDGYSALANFLSIAKKARELYANDTI